MSFGLLLTVQAQIRIKKSLPQQGALQYNHLRRRCDMNTLFLGNVGETQAFVEATMNCQEFCHKKCNAVSTRPADDMQ